MTDLPERPCGEPDPHGGHVWDGWRQDGHGTFARDDRRNCPGVSHPDTERAERAEAERDEWRESYGNQMNAAQELIDELTNAEAAVRTVEDQLGMALEKLARVREELNDDSDEDWGWSAAARTLRDRCLAALHGAP